MRVCIKMLQAIDSLRQWSLGCVWEGLVRDEGNKSFSSSDEGASPDVKVECLACLIQLASTCFSANPTR